MMMCVVKSPRRDAKLGDITKFSFELMFGQKNCSPLWNLDNPNYHIPSNKEEHEWFNNTQDLIVS